MTTIHRRKGFTLIELLVVIAILLALAALVFVVASRAVQQARIASSMNKMRDVGSVFGVYAAELCYNEKTCQIVALRGQDIIAMPLEAAVANHKRVPPDGELVNVARAIGIELGQE